MKSKDGDLCMEETKQVQCPVLIVHGAKDAMCPHFHAEYFKENNRGSEMVIMEKRRYHIHLRYSQKFNQLIKQFLLISKAKPFESSYS